MTEYKRPVPLYSSRRGVWVRIFSLPAGAVRAQLIRLGLNEGEKIFCLHRLPGGTTVVRKHRQQIAIGAVLARQILVTIVGELAQNSVSTS